MFHPFYSHFLISFQNSTTLELQIQHDLIFFWRGVLIFCKRSFTCSVQLVYNL